MKPIGIVLLVIAIILVAAMIVLYFLGKKAQKKKEEQDEQMKAAAQTVTMLIIDKKRMKMKDAGLPSQVMEQAELSVSLKNKDSVHHTVQKITVMRYRNHNTVIMIQIIFKNGQCRDIKIVGWFVKNQYIGSFHRTRSRFSLRFSPPDSFLICPYCSSGGNKN